MNTLLIWITQRLKSLNTKNKYQADTKIDKERQRKDNRRAAKRLIKNAKKHPEWYTDQEIWFAKRVKKELKRKK